MSRRIPTLPAIKTCPFCGGHGVLVEDSLDRGNGHGHPGDYEYHVECEDCGVKRPGGTFWTVYLPRESAMVKAIEHWNYRGEVKSSLKRKN